MLFLVELEKVQHEQASDSTEEISVDEVGPKDDRRKSLLCEAVIDDFGLEKDL